MSELRYDVAGLTALFEALVPDCAQPDTEAPSYGDQCADTDGMALSRQQTARRILDRLAGWAAPPPPLGAFPFVIVNISVNHGPTPIATLVAADPANYTATALPLPARALRPHPQRGGLHCGPF